MIARIHKAMKAKDEKDQGFTLIELLVVIIIIGILAAIAIPVFLNQRKKGWDAAIKSDLKNAATAQETLLTDYNLYRAGTISDVAVGTPTSSTATLGNYGFKYSAAGNYDATWTQKITSTVTNVYESYRMCATSASTAVWVYDSALGGLQPAGTGC